MSGAPVTTGGIPGTSSNLPRPRSAAGLTASGHSRRSENLAFQNSRVVRTTRIPQGEVERVSVALLVDHEVRWEGEGADARRVVAPPAPERLETIRELVAGAVGLREDRGDRLVVESLPFEATRNWQPPDAAPPGPTGSPLPEWLRPYLENRWIVIAAGGGLLLLLAIAGLFLLARKRRGRRVVRSVTTQAALPSADAGLLPGGEEGDIGDRIQVRMAEHAAAKARVEEEALKSLRLPPMKTKKTEVLTKHLADEAQKDPVAMAQLMRTWLDEESD
jgi:flagellar M-ring protein FliF